MRASTCERLSPAYLLGDLTADERSAFEEHLAECDRCAGEVRELREVMGALGASVAQAPPVTVRSRLLQSIAGKLPFEETLQARWDEGGLSGILAYLNAGTSYRFTGLYRAEEPMLRNVRLHDRASPESTVGSDAALTDTYCSLVLKGRGPFEILDALSDPRLTTHPAREDVRAYCGVPAFRADGTPFGTLCHFDDVARTSPPGEPERLRAAADFVMESLGRS